MFGGKTETVTKIMNWNIIKMTCSEKKWWMIVNKIECKIFYNSLNSYDCLCELERVIIIIIK